MNTGFGMSWLLAGALLLSGCTSVPDKVEPVTPFELDKYLGEWHEVARLDHSFERGLTQVSAHYSMREDGGVKVVNRGFDTEKQAWKEAIGKAYFVDSEEVGRLKVSFFGPFYGGYNIAKLDEGYTMALVIGPNLSYAWLLARDPQPSQIQCEAYLAEADRIGVKREDWIWLTRCD